MYAVAKDLMTKAIVTSPNSPLFEVAGTMETLRISYLPVVAEDGKLRGVISKTDLIHFCLTRESNWRDCLAEEAMNPAVISCSPESTVPDVAALMRDNRIHHVLVLDENENIGVISALDLAEPMLKAYELLRNAQSR